jgi:hypothetical protein
MRVIPKYLREGPTGRAVGAAQIAIERSSSVALIPRTVDAFDSIATARGSS